MKLFNLSYISEKYLMRAVFLLDVEQLTGNLRFSNYDVLAYAQRCEVHQGTRGRVEPARNQCRFGSPGREEQTLLHVPRIQSRGRHL